jgi:hypothetical protein
VGPLGGPRSEPPCACYPQRAAAAAAPEAILAKHTNTTRRNVGHRPDHRRTRKGRSPTAETIKHRSIWQAVVSCFSATTASASRHQHPRPRDGRLRQGLPLAHLDDLQTGPRLRRRRPKRREKRPNLTATRTIPLLAKRRKPSYIKCRITRSLTQSGRRPAARALTPVQEWLAFVRKLISSRDCRVCHAVLEIHDFTNKDGRSDCKRPAQCRSNLVSGCSLRKTGIFA